MILATPPTESIVPHPPHFPNAFRIPLDDSAESKALIAQMAGKEAARKRNQHFPCLGLVVCAHDESALPPNPESVQQAAHERLDLKVTVTAVAGDDPKTITYQHENTFYTRTFQVTYPTIRDKHAATQRHVDLCEFLPTYFPDTWIRQVPRRHAIFEAKVAPNDVTLEQLREAVSKVTPVAPSHNGPTVDVKLIGKKNARHSFRGVRFHYWDLEPKAAEAYHSQILSALQHNGMIRESNE